MSRERITINDSGYVSVPADIQMQDFEIAELFGIMIPTVRANIRAILKVGVVIADLTGSATVVGNSIVPDYYGLDMIMALAFRIHSPQAKVFREFIIQRATSIPRQSAINLYIPINSGFMHKQFECSN